MAYKVETIANYFINKGIESAKPITPLKVQKLVYYAHGVYIGLGKGPLVEGDFQVWRYGPVHEELYHILKDFGYGIITKQVVTYNLHESIDSAADKDFLDAIWKYFGGYSAIQLSNSTHRAGTPWANIDKKYNSNVPFNERITNMELYEFFNPIANDIIEKGRNN